MVYYTLEDFNGHIYLGCENYKTASRLCKEMSYSGICYKRKVGGDAKKIAFMW